MIQREREIQGAPVEAGKGGSPVAIGLDLIVEFYHSKHANSLQFNRGEYLW